MLIRYKKSQEKIAMGLLSFMPVEKKDIKLLQTTMQAYNENPNWHLYLWKNDEDIVGAIGIKIEDDINAVVQHISVNPSYRNLGIGKKMVEAVERQYGDKYDVCPDDFTQGFFDNCNDKDKEDQVEDTDE